MVISKLHTAPCGSHRPNCRYVNSGDANARSLCQIHTAWCPDDHHPRPVEEVLAYLAQRSYRTGGW